jgi:predicted small metal-binding protein
VPHQYGCSACAFVLRSEDDDELIRPVRNHARDVHDPETSKRDVRDGWGNVEAPAGD